MKPSSSQLRIIAGKFRGRKIIFEGEAGLRPTHDRIRETVFNWLQPVIEGSYCLDAFAGSGAMGFEALSRGANHVTFVDISKNAINSIQENVKRLGVKNADFHCCDFTAHNTSHTTQFDIVFLDPPFQKNILLQTCTLLMSRNLLRPGALIYLECQRNSVDFSMLPGQWIIKKQQSTKKIDYLLCQFI